MERVSVGGLTGGDVAEVYRQRRRDLLCADLRADDLEIVEQALLVFDDLRLGGGDR